MRRPDTRFHEMFNRLTEYIVVRNLQSFLQVFFIIPRIENEYRCHNTIDVGCSSKTIRFSRYVMADDADTFKYTDAWNFLPNFILVEYDTLEKIV